MAQPLLPDDLWAIVAPLLPAAPPTPKGGRPCVSDRACLTGMLFVLKSGIPWGLLPAEMGCGSGVTQRLGRHRWVIERTLAWLTRYRRLTIRYDRRVDIHQAFLTLGRALICFNHLPSDDGHFFLDERLRQA